VSAKKVVKYAIIILCTVLMFISSFVVTGGVTEKTVYLRDGGNGDGSSYENAIGDFKSAVRLLADSGGRIVICGKYTFNKLIALSEQSGTANNNRTITVTSVDGEKDYRITDNAALCMGDDESSANMVLAGDFVFEKMNIITNGSEIPRAIICGGNKTVFGEGIICKKIGKAPYVSVVGVSFDENVIKNGKISIESGTYNYVCAGNRNGIHKGDTSLTINGGTFEGMVSVSGIEGESNVQDGDASITINGGNFLGPVGAITKVSGELQLVINGGTFRTNITAMGKTNNIEINGGGLQNVDAIRVGYSDAPAESGNDKPNETKESSIININTYNGDVNKLVSKIQGDGIKINIKTEGGSDIETGQSPVVTTPIIPNTSENTTPEQTEKDDENNVQNSEKNYLLGSRENTVIVCIALVGVVFLSIVALVYRAIHGNDNNQPKE